MSNENFVTIRNYTDHIVAEIMISALHQAGIETFALSDSHSMFPSEKVEIKVKESDVDTALEVIELQESL
jgi:hypothetical protein